MTVLEILSVSVLLTYYDIICKKPPHVPNFLVRERKKNPEEKRKKPSHSGFYDKKQRKSVLFAYFIWLFLLIHA